MACSATKRFTTSTPASSCEMPMTCSRSPYFACSAIKSGISARHGGHHVAQKLTIVTLPRSDASEISRPSIVLALKDGASAGCLKNRIVIRSPAGSGDEASAASSRAARE